MQREEYIIPFIKLLNVALISALLLLHQFLTLAVVSIPTSDNVSKAKIK